jgi:hypothetical protein
MGVSALAVEFIRAGLQGIVLFDRGESSDRVEKSDRTKGASGIRSDEEEAA